MTTDNVRDETPEQSTPDGVDTADTMAVPEAVEPIPGEDVDDSRGHRDAAKYRRRLRETEAERDQLAAAVDQMRRREVERIAERIVLKPASIWAASIDVNTLLDDAGNIDSEKAAVAIQQARQVLGLSPSNHGLYNRFAGNHPGPPKITDDMAAAIMG